VVRGGLFHLERAREAETRMTPLGQRIAALIASQGPIALPEFMTLALLDPLAGYYATRQPIGADFITAPEVSQMFGELIGLWLAQCWHDQGRAQRPLLVELGPGRGTLMADALRAMKLMPEFRDQIEVVLVEASPVLAAQQRKTLADCGVPLRWAAAFDAVPKDRPLFLIANEFFDALPIRQYVRTERGWNERMVTVDTNGALAFVLSPVVVPAGNMPANRVGAPPGGVHEMSPAGEALVEEIGHVIAREGGAALIVDYGYDMPGFSETLQAVQSHSFADVLNDPGAMDLSAHVDFAALGDAAVRGGAAAHGPVPQGNFLDDLGIRARADVIGNHNPQMRDALNEQVARLINADQMGLLFKALAIVPKSAPPPPGF
jgi:NADH dehydrogenase [ubiquinone] 1 alpha subcomplex assembly factor 7